MRVETVDNGVLEFLVGFTTVGIVGAQKVPNENLEYFGAEDACFQVGRLG